MENMNRDKISGRICPTHGMSKTRLHSIWRMMKNRCFNKNHRDFYRWGARGITVCRQWRNDFLKFKEFAVNNGYNDNLQIDRIDNNKGYYPCNCRFVTPKINSRNRNNTKINFDTAEEIRRKYKTGKYLMKDLAKLYGYKSHRSIGYIVNNEGWI